MHNYPAPRVDDLDSSIKSSIPRLIHRSSLEQPLFSPQITSNVNRYRNGPEVPVPKRSLEAILIVPQKRWNLAAVSTVVKTSSYHIVHRFVTYYI